MMSSLFRAVSLPVPSRRPIFFLFPLLWLLAFEGGFLHAESSLLPIGVAKVDITPDGPVRLSGYGMRTTESEGVDQKIWAKALAIGEDKSGVSIFVTVDNTGVPSSVTEAVFQALAAETSLRRENFVVASSHTHTAPMLTGILPFLFSTDIPAEQQERIDQYTRELIENLRKVSLAALADRKAASLSWGEGTVGFAKNRVEANGPVDHALPILAVRSPEGDLRAVLANYACHCTTLSHNKIHGDWAGEAQELIEADHPGSIAMISIGTGADANPEPRGELALARQHGKELTDEVSRLLRHALAPLTESPSGSRKSIELAFDTLPSREQWLAKSAEAGIVGYHAMKNLERLDRGESLPTTLPYTVQEWHFGEDLTMVFLPGEVVSDYGLRLKKEFKNLWVTAYANDVPCYIPSERVLALADGPYRYEGGFAMHYYDRPTRFAKGLEKRIIDAVHEIVPAKFLVSDATGQPQLEGTRVAARQILDDALPQADRDCLIREHAAQSAVLLREMIVGIDEKPGEEYRRIPWIWKVTIAAGRRNQEKELRQILEISTPAIEAPLTHWQAVVLGGGVINGITLAGAWPKPAIDQVLATDSALQKRWNRALDLASKMADDASVPAGTRYDALRMIALQPWETSGGQLRRTLTDANHDLQQGAVSGLGDLDAPAATAALIENLNALTDSNRMFALEALRRSPQRIQALREAIKKDEVSREIVGEDWIHTHLK